MKSFFLLILLGNATKLTSQDIPNYPVYSIEEFARIQFQDSLTFYKSFYAEAKYPGVARENNLEGIVEVLVINHSDTLLETFGTNPDYQVLLSEIHETMVKTKKEWLHADLPFMLRFCVNYDLISGRESRSNSVSSCRLIVTAYRLQELRDSDYVYNQNDISYKPQIYGYPYFRNPKKIETQYHPIESIEELLEEAVKASCHKSIKFKQLPPIPPHAQGIYTEPKGYLRLIFNINGSISKVQLFGDLTYKLDAVALYNKLKSVRFKPALLDNKPVHVALDYIKG